MCKGNSIVCKQQWFIRVSIVCSVGLFSTLVTLFTFFITELASRAINIGSKANTKRAAVHYGLTGGSNPEM